MLLVEGRFLSYLNSRYRRRCCERKLGVFWESKWYAYQFHLAFQSFELRHKELLAGVFYTACGVRFPGSVAQKRLAGPCQDSRHQPIAAPQPLARHRGEVWPPTFLRTSVQSSNTPPLRRCSLSSLAMVSVTDLLPLAMALAAIIGGYLYYSSSSSGGENGSHAQHMESPD
jgi:hypothetical protein